MQIKGPESGTLMSSCVLKNCLRAKASVKKGSDTATTSTSKNIVCSSSLRCHCPLPAVGSPPIRIQSETVHPLPHRQNQHSRSGIKAVPRRDQVRPALQKRPHTRRGQILVLVYAENRTHRQTAIYVLRGAKAEELERSVGERPLSVIM